MKYLNRSCILIVVLLWTRVAGSQPAVTTIEPRDVVIVTVEGQPGLGGQYSIEADGSLALPLIGRIDAEGLTAEALAGALARRLDAYFKEPLVQVAVRRTERVFVLGDVKKPGVYDLTKGMTVLELLVQAQYSGVSEVLVVRTGDARAPVLADQAAPSDVIRVNLRELEKDLETGDLSRNLLLESGDTVFVPPIDANGVHVTGEVRSPGSFSVPDGTTVRQALALAGGATEYGSLRRLQIFRIVDDEQRPYRLDLDDSVRPGDTIVVPEAFSFSYPVLAPSIGESQGFQDSQSFSFTSPALPLGTGESQRRPPGQFRIGSVITLTPSLVLRRFGIDTNVFNTPQDRKADFVVELGPQLQTDVDLRRVQVNWTGTLGFSYFRKYRTESGASPGYSVSTTLPLSRYLTLAVGRAVWSPMDRPTSELDARVRRRERQVNVGARLGPWRRINVEFSGGDRDVTLPGEVTFLGVQLRPTLTERIRTITTRANFAVTPLSSVFILATAATYGFPLFPARDADSTVFSLGTTFKRRAFVEGGAQVGFVRYVLIDSTGADFKGLSTSGALWHTWRERAQLGVRGERYIGSSFRAEFPYAVVNGLGGWIQLMLPASLDFVGEAYHDQFNYRAIRAAGNLARPDLPSETTIRYTSQFGVRVNRARVALEVSYFQRLGNRAADTSLRNYNGWRTSVVYDVAYGFFQMRRNDGSSIRGKDGFTNY